MNKIPKELLSAYTMNGKIPVKDAWRTPVSGSPITWGVDKINQIIKDAQNKVPTHYPQTGPYLYQALDAYPVKNKKILVVGSTYPMFECILLTYGAKPITVDYQTIVCKDPRIQVININKLEGTEVDGILSISSIEHSGLGRYGDDLDPDGDIKTMQQCLDYVKPGALFFLAVPVADKDALCWNAHRIYGSIRLPLLLNASNGKLQWKLLHKYGPQAPKRGRCQPVFVLIAEDV